MSGGVPVGLGSGRGVGVSGGCLLVNLRGVWEVSERCLERGLVGVSGMFGRGLRVSWGIPRPLPDTHQTLSRHPLDEQKSSPSHPLSHPLHANSQVCDKVCDADSQT